MFIFIPLETFAEGNSSFLTAYNTWKRILD